VSRNFNPPILAGIVGLVAVSLLAALGAMLLVTFRGPPPHARPLSLDEVAAAIRTGQGENGDWTLTWGREATEPVMPGDMRPVPMLANALALRLGQPQGRLRLYMAGPPRFGGEGGGPMPPFPGMAAPGTGRPAASGTRMPETETEMPFFPPMPDHFPAKGKARKGPMVPGSFLVAWQGTDGAWRSFGGKQIGSLRWYAITLSLMMLIFAALLAPAIFIARRITGPIHRLAEGVAAGGVERADPLPVEGPPEVQRLGLAFNRMRTMLVGHVAERTSMLVAIAHDLRTPMTRLSFRLEHLPDAERVKAQADVEEMRGMVTALLDFVRGGPEPAPPVRMDLLALVETLVDDLSAAQMDVTLIEGERAVVLGDAAALRRCIGNIVENAVRYGGRARLFLAIRGNRAILSVEDDGPGISEEQIERLCEPFYRGEQSRNRATGGVGLGLSIARAIAERHGGVLAFANRTEGGLRVTLSFPLAR
jgi:signal transduction histidine kinase